MSEPAHFSGWSLGARFYPVVYALTRVGEARDWGTGLVLRHALLGHMSELEVHHIFPRALLYRAGFERRQVNAVANFCFLTKDTNLQISARPPAEYFREVEAKHPGALSSQWMPMDEELWETENYARFLEERQRLLAAAANELLHEAPVAAEVPSPSVPEAVPDGRAPVPGGIEDAEEEAVLRAVNAWLRDHGLPEGHIEHELAHPETGDPLAIVKALVDAQAGLAQPREPRLQLCYVAPEIRNLVVSSQRSLPFVAPVRAGTPHRRTAGGVAPGEVRQADLTETHGDWPHFSPFAHAVLP